MDFLETLSNTVLSFLNGVAIYKYIHAWDDLALKVPYLAARPMEVWSPEMEGTARLLSQVCIHVCKLTHIYILHNSITYNNIICYILK